MNLFDKIFIRRKLIKEEQLAKELNSITSEACYSFKVKEVNEQEIKDNLFGV